MSVIALTPSEVYSSECGRHQCFANTLSKVLQWMTHSGRISAEVAKKKAGEEYAKFHQRTMYELSPVELHFIENFEKEQKLLKSIKWIWFVNNYWYDDTQENRTVEAVWQSDICHICCIDFGDIIACLLQSLRYSDGYTTETGQYSDNPLSVYDLHQEDGNIGRIWQ